MRELREAKPKTGFAFRDSWLAPRNALLFLIPFVISSCEDLGLAVLAAWQVGADQSLCLDNDQHVLRFSDRVDGTGGGVGLPGRQSCRWPVSEQGLII